MLTGVLHNNKTEPCVSTSVRSNRLHSHKECLLTNDPLSDFGMADSVPEDRMARKIEAIVKENR